MSHPPRWRFALAGVLLTLGVTPPAAHAQLGTLVRKATHAVTPGKQASPSPAANRSPVRYSSTMLELTPARLGQVLDGLAAKVQALATADGIGMAAMNHHAAAVEQRLKQLDSATSAERPAYQQAKDRYDECLSNGIRAAARAHQTERMRTMTNPALQQQMAVRAQAMSLAMQRGDTVRMHQLQAELAAPMTAMASQDSAEARRQCPAVAASRDVVEDDSLRKVDHALRDRMRIIEMRAATAAAQRSGLTQEQYDVAEERLAYYLARLDRKQAQAGFSRSELAALDARRADIQRLGRSLASLGQSM